VKRIIVFSGPPCSGKSTLGAKLSTTRSIPHLELDAIRARILPNFRNSREDHLTAHRALHLVAEVFLDLNMNVIANAMYNNVEERRDVEELAARLGAPLYLIECRVPPQTAILRNARRRDQHPDYELTDERVFEMVNAFPYYGRGLVVDSTDPLIDCMTEIEQYLKSAKPLVLGKWSAGIPVPLPETQRGKDQAPAQPVATSIDSRRRV
jgi:predicted kinase